MEVLDSGHTIRFLFLGGNGLRKAAAGEGGRGGRSVGKRGGSRGRQLSPRRRLSDWGGGAAPVFTYIAAPVTPARCPHVSAPPMASSSRASVNRGFLLVGRWSQGSTRAHRVWLGKGILLTPGGARWGEGKLGPPARLRSGDGRCLSGRETGGGFERACAYRTFYRLDPVGLLVLALRWGLG